MKIYIDMSHGCGQDRGADGYLNEEVMADKMIALVVTKLRSLGHEVKVQRPSGNLTVSQSLQWRCTQANNWGADIFISVHNNAGGGYGAEVYTYNADKLAEAQRYLQYIINHGGSVHDNNRKNANSGIKNGSGLFVINETSMKAMLLENFYVDTKSDCDFFENNIEMFANALVYGITGVDVESKPIIKEEVKEEIKVDYIIQFSNPVDQAIAEVMADRLCCPTINCQSRPFAFYGQYKIVIAVGQATNKSGYTNVLIQGKDRSETLDKAIAYCKSQGR